MLSNLFSNIHYLSPVPPLELLSYISTADVGIHMMDSSSVNHQQALPNKPMQYMAAGLPCIVSNLEVMSNLIKEANSGWVIKEGDIVELTNVIDNISNEDIAYFRENAIQWFVNNNWEKESKKLTSIYKNILQI